jgi:hypothetical protein
MASASAKAMLPVRRVSAEGLGTCAAVPSPRDTTNRRLHARPGDDFGEGRRRSCIHHDRVDAGIVQLVLELARRVHRIHVHLRGAGAQDPDHRDRKGRNVRHHDRDTVAFLHPELSLQVGGKVAREPVDVCVRERLAEAAERRLVGECLHRLVQHLDDGAVGVRIDFGGKALAVSDEPGSRGHRFLLLAGQAHNGAVPYSSTDP